MRLKGKVAAWFYGIIVFVAVVEVPLLIVSVWIEPDLFGAAISFLVLICVESLCLSIAIRNYVEFQAEGLLIIFGFIKKSIPYDEIICISATKEPWSSLAASTDRIKIKTKSKGDIMISVVDKERFFSEMQSRKPGTMESVVGDHKAAKPPSNP